MDPHFKNLINLFYNSTNPSKFNYNQHLEYILRNNALYLDHIYRTGTLNQNIDEETKLQLFYRRSLKPLPKIKINNIKELLNNKDYKNMNQYYFTSHEIIF